MQAQHSVVVAAYLHTQEQPVRRVWDQVRQCSLAAHLEQIAEKERKVGIDRFVIAQAAALASVVVAQKVELVECAALGVDFVAERKIDVVVASAGVVGYKKEVAGGSPDLVVENNTDLVGYKAVVAYMDYFARKRAVGQSRVAAHT